MNIIPAQLLAAVDGALVPVFFVMILLALSYLWRLWRDNGYSFKGIEIDAKAAWATVTLFLGLSIKNDVAWLTNYLARNDIGLPSFDGYAQAALLVGSAVILWASICWTRNVMPIRFGCHCWLDHMSPSAWSWLVAFSVAFGIWFAL